MTPSPIISLEQAFERLREEAEVYLFYDESVAWVAEEIVAAVPVRSCVGVETSEELKTLETVQQIERQLLEADASRKALLLAVGGGITTDMVGFAASIYKRGVRYANVPTTLLSQVDAAIGGKTGVNLDGYKNMLGAFRMPEFTLIHAPFLRTLPERELRCGLAEMLKTFLIGSASAYEEALASGGDPAKLQDLVRQAAQIKCAIVEEDPFEQGIRAKLNLGHTFGHAIEHEARRRDDDITHGEAVAMGILMAARLSEALGACEKGLAARLRNDFERLGLPTECPYPAADLLSAMHKDKKALAGGRVKFVLLHAPGDVFLQEMTPEQAYDCNFPAK